MKDEYHKCRSFSNASISVHNIFDKALKKHHGQNWKLIINNSVY